MRKSICSFSRPLAVLTAVLVFQGQLAFGDGCTIPTFAGARMFGAASGSQIMATGDFNGDGIPDVAVTNSSGSVSILLGQGDGTFQAAVTYPVAGPSWIATADFNGDGKLDLAISGGPITIMFGKGDGTFTKGGGSSTPAGSLAVGDFNGDGKADLAVGGAPAYLLLGNGDGSFKAAVAPAGNAILAGIGVAVGDFNGDGKLDVVAGVQGGFALMLGDGKGTLAAPVTFDAGTSFLPDRIAVADVNGDKNPDVVLVTSLNKKVSVVLGTGGGKFANPITYPIGDLANGIVIADLNGDGVPDFAVANHASISTPGTISVFLGYGDGTFAASVDYNPTTQANWALAAGDFNSDGIPDLVFSSIVTNMPTQIGVLAGNGDGTFQSPRSFNSGGTLTRTPVLADFNGDGLLDVVVPNAGINGKAAVILANPDGTFQDPVNLNTAFGAKSVAVGDMNGDGKPDIVVANGSSSNVLIFPGNGDGTFQDPKATGSLFLSTYIVLADFNNDGKLDAAVRGINGAQILLGNGDGTFRSGVATYGVGLLCTGCSQGPLLAADLNGDGNADIVIVNGDTDSTLAIGQAGTIAVLLGKGDGTFQTAVSYTAGANATAVAATDLNGDGRPDLLVSDFGGGNGLGPAGTGALAVLLNNGDGTFQKAVRYTAGQGASWVLTGDFDGDGFNDVAVLGRSSRTVTIYLGVGDGTLRNALSYGTGAGDPVGMALADINADGKPDMLVADQNGNQVLTLMNTFVPGTAVSACTPVAALAN